MKKTNKGFTLIELLAVIVILGILMLIAIPSVTKYIDSSKKETYIKTISNMVDVIRYGVLSENSNYNMAGKTTKKFNLKEVELEKGSNKSPYGSLEENYSFIVVTKVDNGYKYEVQVKDTGGYCIELINVDELNESKIVKCDDSKMEEYIKTYSIGDTITFAGSNWYVIKDSNIEDDYVTLMRENILSSTELGDFAFDSTATMPCAWSDTCHYSGSYGYTDTVITGCTTYKDYSHSKIKTFLEEVFINTLDAAKLKEIDGYKIRLITTDDLINNLGWTSSTALLANNNVPRWVYQNFGETTNNVDGYWTMTPGNASLVWLLTSEGKLANSNAYHGRYGIRPVINLLKNDV